MITDRKKAAIITFSRNVNYGGALQEFALYTVLKDEYDVVCVDSYDPMIRANSRVVRRSLFTAVFMVLKRFVRLDRSRGDTQKPERDPNRRIDIRQALYTYVKEGLNQISVICGDLINYRARKRLLRNYKDFWKQYLAYTPLYTERELFSGACGGFDVYIAGSDQIWNPIKFGLSTVYFLAFPALGARKISYASSFGNFHFKDKYMVKKIRSYLTDFSRVSVRESQSVEELWETCGIYAKVDIDPTLLMDREKWIEALDLHTYGSSAPYLLVYLLGSYKRNIRCAKQIARKLGMPVRVLNNKPLSEFFKSDRQCTYFPEAGPDAFVSMFLNASFVVTDSFHGTAFSVNFNIPFVSIESRVPERVISLLKPMQLTDRIVRPKTEDIECVSMEVDFTYAQQVLRRQREQSLSDLYAAIEGVPASISAGR